MKLTKLYLNEDYTDYNEIYQNMAVKFSFLKKVSDGYREIFPKVLCRDYLSDVVASSILGNGSVSGIYCFDSSEMIDTDRLRMSVSIINEQAFEKGIRIINNLEREFEGLQYKTMILKTNIDGNYVIIADKLWIKSPLTIAIFTHLIRCINHNTSKAFRKYENMFKDVASSFEGNDITYIRTITESNVDLRLLIKNIDKVLGSAPATGLLDESMITHETFDVDPDEDELLEYLHNNSGIIGLSNNIKYMREYGTTHHFVGSLWAYNYLQLNEKVDIPCSSHHPAIKLGVTIEVAGKEFVVTGIDSCSLTFVRANGGIEQRNIEHLNYSLVSESKLLSPDHLYPQALAA